MTRAADRGASAEALAASWLEARGLKLIARNVRFRYGEIDLVMDDGEALVFVEVRYRARDDYGGAAASVTAAKRTRHGTRDSRSIRGRESGGGAAQPARRRDSDHGHGRDRMDSKTRWRP